MKRKTKLSMIVVAVLVVNFILCIHVAATSSTWRIDGFDCHGVLDLSKKYANATYTCTPNPGPVSTLETCEVTLTAYYGEGKDDYNKETKFGYYENGVIRGAVYMIEPDEYNPFIRATAVYKFHGISRSLSSTVS